MLTLEPSLEMDYFKNGNPFLLWGEKEIMSGNEFSKSSKFRRIRKLGLIYTGDFGMSSAAWEKLAGFTDWEFLGLNGIGGGAPNYHLVDKSDFRYQDLTSSVDVVISKIGYGVISECFLNGTPLIYLPRDHFVEYPVLEKAVISWGGGTCLSEEQFNSLQWSGALERSFTKRLHPLLSDGARLCAEAIARAAAQG